MADSVVHGIPANPFMRAVLVALEEKGAPYGVHTLTRATRKAA